MSSPRAWAVPFVFVLISLIWGSSWMFVTIGLEEFPPFLFAGLRFAGAGILLLALARVQGIGLPDKGTSGAIMLLGIAGLGFSIALQYWAQQRITSGHAAVLFSTMPLFTALGAWLWLSDEHLTWLRVGGLALGVVGTAFLMSSSLTMGNRDMARQVAVLLGAAAAGIGIVWSKRLLAKADPVVFTGLQMTPAGLGLVLIGLLTETVPSDLPAAALLSLLYLTLAASCVAFLGYYWIMQRASVVTMSLITFVTPPIAVTLGAVFLHEPLGWSMVVGMISVAGGIVLVEAVRS